MNREQKNIETIERNKEIAKEFDRLRAEGNSAQYCTLLLSEKYFLSEGTIGNLYYRLKSKGEKDGLKNR